MLQTANTTSTPGGGGGVEETRCYHSGFDHSYKTDVVRGRRRVPERGKLIWLRQCRDT